jgi:hypothetical protein
METQNNETEAVRELTPEEIMLVSGGGGDSPQ